MELGEQCYLCGTYWTLYYIIVLCKIITLWNWENSAISVVYMPAVIRMRYYCCCVFAFIYIIIIIEELLEVLSLLAIHLLLFKYGLIETHISSSEIVLTLIYKIILQYNSFYTHRVKKRNNQFNIILIIMMQCYKVYVL